MRNAIKTVSKHHLRPYTTGSNLHRYTKVDLYFSGYTVLLTKGPMVSVKSTARLHATLKTTLVDGQDKLFMIRVFSFLLSLVAMKTRFKLFGD